MKIAILSDIHGNLPPLQAVADHIQAWRPDHTIVAGDIVNRGPSSAECLRFVQGEPGWRVVRGNQEDHILEYLQGATPGGPLFEVHRLSYWTFRQLDGQVVTLGALPDEISFTAPDGSELRICHASMRGNQDGIGPHSALDQVRQQIAPAPALFGTAHIHIPFIRRVDDTLIVNSGSVGCPCDGDTRASYAQVEWHNGSGWHARILRLEYDMAQAERAFVKSGFFQGCGPLGQLIFQGWRIAQPLLFFWVKQQQAHVLAGEIGLGRSVSLFLEQRGLKGRKVV